MFDLEPDALVMIARPAGFPLQDISEISARLENSNVVVPAFIPPEVGALSVDAVSYAQIYERQEFIVIPDRNVASRMARIPRLGAKHPFDDPTRTAIDLMAFCQAMDVIVDPSIAFHELAHKSGNDVALEELRWFRAADFGQAKAWIDISQGRSEQLVSFRPADVEVFDLQAPLERWRRNYAVALQAANLELTTCSPMQRFTTLIDWMVSDFIVAGPAAIYSAMALSPFASRKGLFKQIKSPDRWKSISGVQNAAWDMTYLSELVRLASDRKEDRRYLFASNDRALIDMTPSLFLDAEEMDEFEAHLTSLLAQWWRGQAPAVAKILRKAIDVASVRSVRTSPDGIEDYVGMLIATGEAAIRSWPPKT